MSKSLLPIFLSIIFISESIFVEFFLDNSMSDTINAPHFLFITLCMSAIFINRNISLIYAFIFGFIYDIFYTDILGIYAFLFTLLVYLFYLVMKALNSHLLVVSIVVIVNIIILEFLVYGILLIFKDTSMALYLFTINRLLPTILLNLVFMIIFSYLIKKFYKYINKLNYSDL
jgi:rod shape-determining protein MreD